MTMPKLEADDEKVDPFPDLVDDIVALPPDLVHDIVALPPDSSW